MAGRRGLDFCCLQETRWRGKTTTPLGEEGRLYKFFYQGGKKKAAGVGVLVAEKWIDKVIEVKRVSERILVLRVAVGKSVLWLVCVCMLHRRAER